jgi:hypothetical protein
MEVDNVAETSTLQSFVIDDSIEASMFEDINYLVFNGDGPNQGTINWEQSYHILKSTYSKEKLHLAADITDLKAALEEKNAEVARLTKMILHQVESGMNKSTSAAESTSETQKSEPDKGTQGSSTSGKRKIDNADTGRKYKKRIHYPEPVNNEPDNKAKDPDVSH